MVEKVELEYWNTGMMEHWAVSITPRIAVVSYSHRVAAADPGGNPQKLTQRGWIGRWEWAFGAESHGFLL
jgi:hypothetical protein